MCEMTEDEYNELSPRARFDVDRVRLHLNKERLKKYSMKQCYFMYSAEQTTGSNKQLQNWKNFFGNINIVSLLMLRTK